MEFSIHEAERIERRGRRLMSGAILAAIALISATWLGLFAFLGANTAHGTLQDLRDYWLPDVEAMTLELPDLSRLSTVYTADGVVLGQLTERNSQPTPLDDIPNLVLGAVLSAEDADFMTHGGIDYQAIARALIEDLGGGPTQGGSTITQQVVKQNFIGREPSLERKVAEAAIAIELERRFTKEQILEFYLSSVFFGSNAYGVKAAAEEYFDKRLDELTIAQAAALPVPIRNPSLYNLRNDSEIPLRARNAVIDQMVEEGYITAAEGAVARAEPLRTVEKEEFQDPAPQVLLAAKDTVLNDARYGIGATYLQRTRALFGCPADATDCAGGGGLKIFTTVDFGLQQEARRILQEWFPQGSDGPTGAIAMVDNRTGAQVVIASGLDFGTDLEAGQRQYDIATKGRRNPGSAFKPFGLIAALEQGIPLGSYWDYSTPQIIDFGGIEPWKCANAGRNDPGIRSLEEGLYLSINTVFCQVSVAVGAENIVDVAHRMGIKSPLGAIPSIVLGTQAVSPLDMAAAFSTISNHGSRVDTYLIERIEDADGNVIYQHEVTRTQVLEPALAAAVVNTMEKVVTIGTGRRARLDDERPQAGKTGTHENNTESWFVGYVPQYTAAVWVGFPDSQVEMKNITVNGEFYRFIYGSTLAAPIWKEFMTLVTADLLIGDFPPDPPGIGVYYQTPRVEIPDVTGMEFEEAQGAMFKAGLDVEAKPINSNAPKDTVVGTIPPPGTRFEQGKVVELEVSNGLSPTTVMPNLLGRTEAEVNQILLALQQNSNIGFAWIIQQAPTADAGQHGLVTATNPGPGAPVDEATVITVTVGVFTPPPDP
ncbi:MAG: transglycosylase domain-containing protein [Acidimicrobiia bacterium]